MATMFDRRTILGAPLAAAVPAIGAERRATRVVLLGQSLIQEDLCAQGWPGMAGIRRALAGADVVFTDLETAIQGPGADAATRVGEVLHAAPASVIDCLKSLGVTMVTTANNHAWDLGSGGILAAIEALDRRGIVHAGTGRDLATASAAAFQRTAAGDVGLVSAAAGAIRDGAAATSSRAGVSELRRLASGALDRGDVARSLDAIRGARARGATVIFCLHNHYWEAEQAATPAWQRQLARECVDAGAAAFVAHGTPLMQGIERYKGAPLFHGLGNFVFQTRKAEGFYQARTWQSLIVDARFQDGRFRRADLIPIQLESRKAGGKFSRGYPTIARSKARTLG